MFKNKEYNSWVVVVIILLSYIFMTICILLAALALEVFLIQVSFAMILFSLLLEVFKFVEEVINDILMAIVFGGILLGIGVGFIIRYGACVDIVSEGLDQAKVALYSGVTRLEVRGLKKIVEADDVSDFLTITDVGKIVGQHIKDKESLNINR